MSDIGSVNKEVVSRFYNDVFIHHDMGRLDEYMREDRIQFGIAERLLREGLVSPGPEENDS